MKYWFIVNPVAGKGEFAKKVCVTIRDYAKEKDLDFKICLTKCKGDATRIARDICEKYPEEKVIFACGGDGIVSEVVSGLADYDNVTLGVIPGGTGNDFVRSFSDRESFSSLDAQMEGTPVRLDAIHYTDGDALDRYSLNVLNMGFDCYVVTCAEKARKLPLVRSSLAYVMGVFMALSAKPGLKGEISVDGGEYEAFNLMFLLGANGSFYGGGYCPAPKASMQDGKMDLCMVNNVSRTTLLRLLSSYRKGTFMEQKLVQKHQIAKYCRCEEIRVRFPEPSSVCGDGEIDTAREVTATICKGKISFLLPQGVTLRNNGGDDDTIGEETIFLEDVLSDSAPAEEETVVG